MQIIFVFVCLSFTQGDHHDFIFAKEESVKKEESPVKLLTESTRYMAWMILSYQKYTGIGLYAVQYAQRLNLGFIVIMHKYMLEVILITKFPVSITVSMH